MEYGNNGVDAVFLLFAIRPKHGHKSALGDGDGTDHFHSFFPLFLLFKKFPLSGDVPTIAFGCHIFSKRRNRRPRDNGSANGPLNRDFKQVSRDFFFQPLTGIERP